MTGYDPNTDCICNSVRRHIINEVFMLDKNYDTMGYAYTVQC